MKTAEASKIKGTYGTMYYVKDMGKAAAFYKERLGAKPTIESPDWTEFNFGGTSLCLHLSRGRKGGGKNEHANGSMVLHVDGIRALVAELKAGGVDVDEVHEVYPGAWSADFRDPSGNVVGLYEGPKSF
ncbi:MAG: VOC family protein [Elusimicrobiota bacterium]